MKKIIFILTVLIHFGLKAQAPQKFSYQIVIRNASNVLVANQAVGIKISILQGSATGTAVYVETHTPTTNANGLASIEIGAGTVSSGVFSTINWSTGTYFVQSDVDPTGGTNYTITGTNQLLSVPYALYAQNSSNGFTHHIGENFGGGIIFSLWKDNANVEHGLIVDINDLGSDVNYSNTGGSLATSYFNGLNNTNSLASNSSNNGTAPSLCFNSNNQGQSDWYLPSINELSLLYNNIYTVNLALSQVSGADLIGKSGSYYSSTSTSTRCFDFNFENGLIQIESQTFQNLAKRYVRAVRAF